MLAAHPEVLNHNVETVRELQGRRAAAGAVRAVPGACCATASEQDPTVLTKTGFMVGLGETEEQIDAV